MARNEEKARSMMNVYLKRHEIGRVQTKRPAHTAFVKTTDECQHWLSQVIREIVDHVALIQNPGLGEDKIREKNDLINKLLRERKFWEKRIMEIGGLAFAEQIGIDVRDERRLREKNAAAGLKSDIALLAGESAVGKKKRSRNQQYGDGGKDGDGGKKFSGQIATSTRALNIEGDFDSKDVIGVDGYFYFGAARDLPGVRELYAKSQVQDLFKVKKRDLKQRADSNYFGFSEDFNERLLREEMEMEERILNKLLEDEKNGKFTMPIAIGHLFKVVDDHADDDDDDDADTAIPNEENNDGGDDENRNQHHQRQEQQQPSVSAPLPIDHSMGDQSSQHQEEVWIGL